MDEAQKYDFRKDRKRYEGKTRDSSWFHAEAT